jgi:toxin-antitoxin system PIN domain toxin
LIAIPDVNVLLALCWANHPHHAIAHAWFQNTAANGWATCFTTQIGFLRLSLNPMVVQAEASWPTARTVLTNLIGHPTHQFLSTSPALPEGGFDEIASLIRGYRQVSDAGLVYLARTHGMKLSSFDRGITAICPWLENLEIISTH